MENINIKINKKTRQVDLSKSVIGNDGENLQENLVFAFNEFVNGTGRLEIIKPDKTKSYLMLTKIDETYQIPIKSVITKTGRIGMQLVITEGTDDEEIPIFKSNQFYVVCNSSINAEIEEPEEYPQWIDVANTKLNQMDNLDIDVEKVDHTAIITVTKKDETQEIVNVYDGQDGADGQDGVGLNYNWSGTSLGVKREDESNYDYVNLQGPVGPAGSIRMVIVNELPLTGEEGTLYFVPKTPDTSDLYDEYVWINNAWELLGEKQITVDLSDYYTKQETYSQAEANTLLSGKQNTIDSSHKLSADLVDDTNSTNKFVSSSDITNWNSKLDSSKVKNANSTTAGDVYDVRYINTLIGDISSAIDLINGEVI